MQPMRLLQLMQRMQHMQPNEFDMLKNIGIKIMQRGISQGTQPMQPQSNGTVEGSAADPHELHAQQMQPPSAKAAEQAALRLDTLLVDALIWLLTDDGQGET